MIRDHSRTTAELRSIARRESALRLPTAMDEQHQGLLKQLRASRGRDFDSLYGQLQVRGHEDAVARFSAYVDNGINPQLRKFALATKPVIQSHLDMARRLPSRAGLVAGG